MHRYDLRAYVAMTYGHAPLQLKGMPRYDLRAFVATTLHVHFRGKRGSSLGTNPNREKGIIVRGRMGERVAA